MGRPKYITMYDDIPFLLNQSYKKSKTTYRTNFSLCVITEGKHNDKVTYEIITPGGV